MRQHRFEEVGEREHSLGLVGEERYGYEGEPEPRRRLPMAVLTLAVMAVFAGGLWFAYTQGAKHAGGGAGGNVPLIRADDRPTKVRPEQPGGMDVPDRDKLVYSDRPGGAPVEKLLPPAEQPQPRPTAPPPQAAPPPAAALPAPALPATPAPSAAATPASAPSPVTQPAPPKAGKPGAQPQVAAAPAAPAAAPNTPPATKAPAKSAAETKAAAAPAPPAHAASQTATQPAQQARPAPAPTPALAAPAPQAAATGGIRVQLASLRTPEAARSEWGRLKQANPDLLGRLSAVAVRADLGEKGIYYRIQAGPFADPTAAGRLCGELKKRNLGCAVAR